MEDLYFDTLRSEDLTFELLAEIAKTDSSISDMYLAQGRAMRILSNRRWKVVKQVVPNSKHITRLIEDGRNFASLGRVQGMSSNVNDFVVSMQRDNQAPMLLRGHAGKDRYGMTLSLRVLNQIPLTLPELGIQNLNFTRLMQERKRDGGLVLVCGPTSSGKSTTLAAMVEEYCREIGGRAVTLEDPIEYPFNQPYHFVTQREVGVEVPTWEEGIMGALRERIDLLMIGELRSADSIRAALQASAAGFFVIASIHVMRIHELPERIALEFSADEYENIRKKLASSLKLVIGQRLLPGLHGTALLYEMLDMERKAKLAFARGSANEIAECTNDASNKLNMNFDRCLQYLLHSGQINHEVFSEWKQQDV